MQKHMGKSISKGIAIGKIYFHSKENNIISRSKIEDKDIDREIARYKAARDTAISQLRDIYEDAIIKVGQKDAEVFKSHIKLLEDVEFNDFIINIIKTQKVNSSYAVKLTCDYYSRFFNNMKAESFRAKADDFRDISQRLIRILTGVSNKTLILDEPIILLSVSLTPSEVLHIDKSKLLALVTQYGFEHSHTSIIARTMGIPAISGIDIEEDWNGKSAIVDGSSGILIINPDESTLIMYKEKKIKELEEEKLLEELKGKDNISLSGKMIDVLANIGSLIDLSEVIKNDANGIGLFRSECVYLERDDYPSEEEQFTIYKKLAETMAGKKVIIRTLDIGADKQLEYFDMDKEKNPALGYRGIRISLTRPDIFKTQLRAILRASSYGNISIMYPMIISLDEVSKIKKIVGEVKKELDNEGKLYKDVEQGIMIETPAAVLISDLLAKEVDFFSIGTNDLSQYTLAIDRQNDKIDDFYNPHHEAILRLIKLVADNAHKEGIRVGICGELAADTSLTATFLDIGIDELSVSPANVLPVRKSIRYAK
ncbi:MAG TPA: phosphoenolpyruvate--protein phosphotransferase [Bacteroidales bacterium]|jgi:phosphotransferase system enzyme I (PtsI)|nr:phosphoenolpyruvate--protein phosphotransferase [Bacteroidales bacterium]